MGELYIHEIPEIISYEHMPSSLTKAKSTHSAIINFVFSLSVGGKKPQHNPPTTTTTTNPQNTTKKTSQEFTFDS